MKLLNKLEIKRFEKLFHEITDDAYRFEQFWEYLRLLLKWNEKINLTAIRGPDEIIEGHFYDSLVLVPYISKRGKVLDIGSGPGFPGIPIKIALPEVSLTVVEANKKKADFITEVVRRLRLDSVRVLNHYLKPGESVGSFDQNVSRGTFRLIELWGLARHNLGHGGKLLTLKGADPGDEIQELKGIYPALNVTPILYRLPRLCKTRSIIVIE